MKSLASWLMALWKRLEGALSRSNSGKGPAKRIIIVIEGVPKMAFNLQDMQKVSATCLGQNAAGNSAPIYGPVTWDNDNPIVVTITPVSDFQFYVYQY